MEWVLIILYAVAGYWAAGVILYENKIIIAPEGKITSTKIAMGIVFGWALIPLAILKRLFFSRC